jgi:hypothetical protein
MSADDATIDRAARAARNANYAAGGRPGKDSDWDAGPGFEPTRERYRRIARAVLDAAGLDAPSVWDPAIPPGGYVCSVCGDPTESEPCPEHQPQAHAAIDAPPVTFAELHGEIARRDQQITELFGALSALVMWWDAGNEPGAVRIAPRVIWDNARNALGWPSPIPDLDAADLRIALYDPPDATCIDSPGRGVTITHIPSGWSSSCHSERSQLQNKRLALEVLKARVAVWRHTNPGR